IAAVVGKDVPFAIVHAVAGIGEDVLRAVCARLKSAEFLHETSVSPDPEYTFRHALTHEVAYASVPPEQRQILHARIVEAIERRYPDRLADHVERLAHHAVLEDGRRAEAITEALGDCGLEVATNADVGQIRLVHGEYRAAAALFRKNVESIVGELIHERFGLPQLPAVHSRSCLVLCLA